jgi:uncharacterized DUF497 family protein
MPKFVWHSPKAASNLRDHKIDFAEAVSVFDDENAVEEIDPDPDEVRLKRLGRTASGRMLVVVYTERSDDTIRIISARKAEKHEERAYYQG